jgi:hypothetical protein
MPAEVLKLPTTKANPEVATFTRPCLKGAPGIVDEDGDAPQEPVSA